MRIRLGLWGLTVIPIFECFSLLRMCGLSLQSGALEEDQRCKNLDYGLLRAGGRWVGEEDKRAFWEEWGQGQE